MEENTIDSIIKSLEDLAKDKGVLDPEVLMTAAEKLKILLQNEDDIVAEKEHELAIARKHLLDEGKNATASKMIIEASPLFLEVRKLNNRIKFVNDFVLLTKKHATLATEMLRQ